MKTLILTSIALATGKPEACRKLAGGANHRICVEMETAPEGAAEISSAPPGRLRLSVVIRWFRSFLTSPPANFHAALRAGVAASFAIAAALTLSGCGPAEAKTHEQPPENGAQYKKDKGLALTDTMKKAIALKVAEVGEAKIAPSFTVALSSSAHEISGWLTEEQAALVQLGMKVELRTDAAPQTRGIVKRIEKAPYATLGDFEVVVETAAPLETGVRVQATFRASLGEAVTAIPRSALLKTAEGNFVYAVNGEFYVRTPVKVGAMSDEHAEITDGLYAGDQVVVSPVMSLWLAELQVLRGGKACSCGH